MQAAGDRAGYNERAGRKLVTRVSLCNGKSFRWIRQSRPQGHVRPVAVVCSTGKRGRCGAAYRSLSGSGFFLRQSSCSSATVGEGLR
jgi:hypothetical protein